MSTTIIEYETPRHAVDYTRSEALACLHLLLEQGTRDFVSKQTPAAKALAVAIGRRPVSVEHLTYHLARTLWREGWEPRLGPWTALVVEDYRRDPRDMARQARAAHADYLLHPIG